MRTSAARAAVVPRPAWTAAAQAIPLLHAPAVRIISGSIARSQESAPEVPKVIGPVDRISVAHITDWSKRPLDSDRDDRAVLEVLKMFRVARSLGAVTRADAMLVEQIVDARIERKAFAQPE